MASNGFVFRPGRGPSFIFVGLVVIVIILFYSYWGVSSKNNKLLRDVSVLQDRLRVLAARKLTSDKKSSALVTQLTQMQDDKEEIEGVIKSRDSEISELKKLLKTKEEELEKLHAQEVWFTVQYKSTMHKFSVMSNINNPAMFSSKQTTCEKVFTIVSFPRNFLAFY